MLKNRQSTLFLILALLAGCSFSQTGSTRDVRAEMIGMSLNEIAICLGAPEKKTAGAVTETWSYTFGTCSFKLEVTDARVKSVSYTETSKDVPKDERCAKIPEVSSCLRWLRRP